MIEACSDNPEIENALDRICQTLIDNGCYISSNIRFSYQDGAFSVLKTGEMTTPYFIKIPHKLLIPYQAFDLDIANGHIVIASYSDKVTPVQARLFAEILALYNATSIFQDHCQDNPWLNYEKHHQIVALLLRGRTGNDMGLIRKMLTDSEFKDELALFTFFKKRVASSRINSSAGALVEVFLPLIEFLRHHPLGARYENVYDVQNGEGFMTMLAANPVENSEECFASYGTIDALEGYLHYGFVADQALFVRSVPAQIELAGLGKIVINANNIPIPIKDRPEHLQDLSHYLPYIKYFPNKNAVRLSHLIVPNIKAPKALRRVLREAVLAFEKNIDEAQIQAYILEIESQIITLNIDYYNELAALVAHSSASSVLVQNLRRIIDKQLSIINAYQSNCMT